MDSKNQVTISTKVQKRLANQLKRIAKEKQLRFSGYIKRILTAEAERQIRKRSEQ